MASSMYISEWGSHGAAPWLLPAACFKGRNIHPGTWHSSMYIRMDLHGAARLLPQQLVPQGRNIHPGTWHSMYISEWDLHSAATTTSSLCRKEKWTRSPMHISEWDLPVQPATTTSSQPQGRMGHGILHVYIRMGSTRCSAGDYYQQLVLQGISGHGISMYSDGIYTVQRRLLPAVSHKGEIYTQGHGIPPCISEWDLHGAALRLLPAACATREKWDMAFLHAIYQNGIHYGAATSYYQQLVPQGRNIHPGHGISMYISEWDLHGAATATTSSLCRKGEIYTQGHGIPPCIYQNGIYTVPRLLPAACATREKYTPRDMAFLHVYIRMGSTRCRCTTTSSLCHKGEIYTQGHGILMYTYQNGIYTVPPSATTSSLCRKEKYTPGTWHSSMYISEWDHTQRCDYYQQLVPQGRNIHPGHGIPPCISEWDLCRHRYYQQLVPQGRNIHPGHGIHV
jgi:hypothetical protein